MPRRNADSKSKRAEAAELYEGMVAAMEAARVGDHQVAALLLKLSEVSAPRMMRYESGATADAQHSFTPRQARFELSHGRRRH